MPNFFNNENSEDIPLLYCDIDIDQKSHSNIPIHDASAPSVV
jgi:hypothetical protein